MRASTSKLQLILPLIVLAIGVVLMTGKIYADSEPGLIPLLLVVIGTVWYCFARVRNRKISVGD